MTSPAYHTCFAVTTCAALGLLSTSGVRAQPARDSVQHLPYVEVTARPRPDVLSLAQTLHIAKTEPMNNYSVADAIRYFSGVQVKDYGGIGGLKTVNIRNMGTHHVGVFYDGIQLGNAQNGQIDLGRFSLDNLEEISLYNGQRTELLQPARDVASASGIYLRTREPHFTKGEKTHFRAALKTGSFGLFNPSFQWDQRLSDSVSVRFNTELTSAHGRYRFRYKMLRSDGATAYDTTAIRQNGDIAGLRAEGALYGRIKHGEWNARLYSYSSERGLPGFIASNLFRHGQRQWDHNLFLQGSLRKQLSARHRLLLHLKYAYDHTRYLDNDPASMYTDNRYHQQETYVSAAQEFSLTRHWKAGLSADYQLNTLRANLVNFSYPTRHTFLAALTSGIQAKHFSAQGNLLATLVRNDVKKNLAAPSANLLTPALHASVQPFRTGDLRIRGAYKKSFRMPTFNDLYYTFIGNAVLDPEYAAQYNMGLTFHHDLPGKRLKNLDIRADAYYNEVTNKIVAVPTSNPFRWMMLNLGLVKIHGLELNATSTWIPAPHLQTILKLNYTFQEARDRTNKNDPFYGHRIPYAPQHSFSATIQAGYRSWQCNYSFIYTGERYSQKANIPRNYLPAWYTSDIGLARSWVFFNIKTTTSLELNNLFNQYYDVVLNYPMPGRTA